jgi:hypothetical protein
MRLLKFDSGNFSLTEYAGDDVPNYAILSHTWGPDGEEVTDKDILENTAMNKTGYEKLRFCARQAMKDGLRYFWMDTCCIDKSSSSELSEAINSMFRWYRNAARCYVYLSDVSTSGSERDSGMLPLRNSRWFTRNWTLQELIAPPSVQFFSGEGELLGDKKSLEQQLHEITRIAIPALQGKPLSEFSVSERMSWAEKRTSKRKEDKAYSLLGIFDVHMPLIYGEGEKHAFKRLQEEISKYSTKYEPDEPRNYQPPFSSTKTPKMSHISTSSIVSFQRDPNIISGNSKLLQLIEELLIRELYCYQPLAGFRFRIFILYPRPIGSNVTSQIHEFSLLNPPTFYALSYV